MKRWSRKTKLAAWALILLITAAFLFFCYNRPSLTPEIAFRRAEKQQLIGPAEIIATLSSKNGYSESILIGKTEHGYTTYEYYNSGHLDGGQMRYFPKTEDATLFGPKYTYYDENGLPYILIFLFPETCSAPLAELTLTISCEDETETYHTEGQRQDGGFYILPLPYRELKSQHYWLLQQALTGAYSEYDLTGTVEISVEYYDRTDNLTDTYQRTVTK